MRRALGGASLQPLIDSESMVSCIAANAMDYVPRKLPRFKNYVSRLIIVDIGVVFAKANCQRNA